MFWVLAVEFFRNLRIRNVQFAGVYVVRDPGTEHIACVYSSRIAIIASFLLGIL